MDESVQQSNVDEKKTYIEPMSWGRIFIYALFGVVLPVSALAADYAISSSLKSFNMLYTVGALFLLPRMAYLYIIIWTGIVTLLLWMIFFRKSGEKFNSFIAGILLFNAFFDLAFGIAAVYRLWLIPVWLPPFCAAPILLLSSIEAMRIARRAMLKRQIAVTAIAGFLFMVMLCLFIIRQPWGLVKHLPNAKGADLSGMDLSHIYLEGCGYAGVTFEEANLSFADLSYASLSCCDLNMHKANLQKANLSHAFLSIVNLTEADLKGANLNNAEIFETDFTGADLRGSLLGFRALGRVTMGNTNLCGADLHDINNISGVYVWKGAKYNSATLWPKNFDPVKQGAVLIADENNKGPN